MRSIPKKKAAHDDTFSEDENILDCSSDDSMDDVCHQMKRRV